MSQKPKCACVSDDAYRCWSLRYHGHSAQAPQSIERDGGPCQCLCHDVYDDDDWLDEPPPISPESTDRREE
jgi:hypothetical protein